ncbi:Gfo/Idh/MocA family protein [Aliiruegeria sabulilitoris]|uniref:Gfo/Idh/MocA family protein n=1 Tax=Aliiruegeria sabulilitoris TaxID=1510458 RepID=UPI00082966B0|nr:Gfo/Idh/MocA family oxidoreductase [Aliiruegeria sabulilitoris]NDR59593.1 Gfo/Idh/MocA family oxidoreductase [Pseudoruegeria sp. M32A2M]
MKIIRWGILGASKFAREYMGPAIHAARGAQLAALATGSPDKAAEFEALFPGIRVHASYEALLDDPEIDAVYIPLPNNLHVEWTKKALAAGKAVLCEKPIALAEADFDQLVAARDGAGLLAAEAYMVVHHPQWERAKALVAEGAIGQLQHVHGAFSYNNPDPANIRNQAATGGGALRDIGVYTLGTARFVSGEEPVSAHASITWVDGYDTTSHSLLQFPSFKMSMMLSTRLAPYQEMVFHGDAGLIRLAFPFNANVHGEAQLELITGHHTRVERWPGVNHYVLQVENFGESLRSGAPYPCPLEFSHGTQAAMDMIFAADPAP